VRKPKLDAPAQAALALAAPLCATAVAFAGASIADALDVRTVDERYAAMVFPAALVLVLLRLTRPGSRWWARVAHGALALPILIVPFVPRSTLAVAWMSGGVLSLIFGANLHGARCAWNMASHRAARAALAFSTFALGQYFFASALVVLLNLQIVVAPIRLANQSPVRDRDEQELVLETDDGYRLGATYTPGSAGAPGIVLAHGVSDGRSRMAPLARSLRARGYHVLRFDFRAHGTSEGAVCTYGQREAADVRAAVDALRDVETVDPSRIAVLGTSMGGGSTLAAAPTLPSRGVRALILLAPASRYPELVAQRVAWLGPLAAPVLAGSSRLARAMGVVPMTGWEPAERLEQVPQLPVLVLHGDRDRSIPLALSRRLEREHARTELVVLEGVAHDEIPLVASRDPHFERLRVFLERELGAR
jgi:alpha-beta hydrolase superfamily lysophospholipase